MGIKWDLDDQGNMRLYDAETKVIIFVGTEWECIVKLRQVIPYIGKGEKEWSDAIQRIFDLH